MHALYGFARWVDDIIDAPRTAHPVERAGCPAVRSRHRSDRCPGGRRDVHPVVRAVADTARRYGIGAELFTEFLRSMRIDLSTTDYADLRRPARPTCTARPR